MKLSPINLIIGLSALTYRSQAQPTGTPSVVPTSNPAGDQFLQALLETPRSSYLRGTNSIVAQSAVASTSSAGVVGEIIALPFETVPPGFLECNGQAVSRDDYPELFAAIGATYGLGSVINTFKVPDCRGYFLRGWNHGAGVDPDADTRSNRGDGTSGDAIGTTQQDAFQGYKSSLPTVSVSTGWANFDSQITGHRGGGNYDSRYYTSPPLDDGHGTPRVSSETRSKNINVLYAIRAKPISDTTQTLKTIQICDQSSANCFSPITINQLVSANATQVVTNRRQDQSIQSLQSATTQLQSRSTVMQAFIDSVNQSKSDAIETLEGENQRLRATVDQLKTQVRDLESVYTVVSPSTVNRTLETQRKQAVAIDSQTETLDRHSLQLLGLTIAVSVVGGIQLLVLVCLCMKKTSPQPINPQDREIPTAKVVGKSNDYHRV